MKEILTALLLWIGANSDYNTNIPFPTIIFMEQEKMEQVYTKAENLWENCTDFMILKRMS